MVRKHKKIFPNGGTNNGFDAWINGTSGHILSDQALSGLPAEVSVNQVVFSQWSFVKQQYHHCWGGRKADMLHPQVIMPT